MRKKQTKKIGELLMEAGLIDEFQLNSSLAYQKSWGGRLGSILLRKGYVTETQMADVISRQYQLTCISLEETERPSDEVLNLIKPEIAKKFSAFPLSMEGGKNLLVAVTDPTDLKMLDDLGFTIGVRIKPVLALESEILRAIETNYDRKYFQGPFVIDKGSAHVEKRKGATVVSPESHNRQDDRITPERIIQQHEPAAPPRPAEPEKPKAEISQKAVIESVVDLLIAKGVFTKEELMQRIRAKLRS